MCDDELTRATEFNREKSSFPLYFSMDLFYEFILELIGARVTVIYGPGAMPDLWRTQRRRQMYLSTDTLVSLVTTVGHHSQRTPSRIHQCTDIFICSSFISYY